ncbi:MAG: hypothetical protein ACLS6O_06195 [Bifidobacterium sp.]
MPGDISVTGFDDSTFAKEAELTTVRQRPYDMAVDAAQRLWHSSKDNPSRNHSRHSRAVASTKLNRKTTHRSPAVGRSVYSREITSRNTHANRSICVMYGRFCFSYGNISLIWHVACENSHFGVRFEVFAACVCHM